MPSPKNNRSKDPSKWSARKLQQELEAKNPIALEHARSPAVRGSFERLEKAIDRLRPEIERAGLVDRLVPNYLDMTGREKQRAYSKFCAMLANYTHTPWPDVKKLAIADIAGMVDAIAEASEPSSAKLSPRLSEGEWIGPISKSAMARRLLMLSGARWRDVEKKFKADQVVAESRQRFSFDLSGLADLEKRRARTPRPGEPS